MDRASDSGSEGWGFESLPVYQIKEEIPKGISSFISPSGRKGTRKIKCNSPVDCCRRRLDGGEPLSAQRAEATVSLPVYHNCLEIGKRLIF